MVLGGGRAWSPACPAFPRRVVPRARCWAGWSGRNRARWAEGGGEQLLVAGLPGPVPGQVQAQSSGGGGDPRRDGDELGADRRRSGLAVERPGKSAGGAGEVER